MDDVNSTASARGAAIRERLFGQPKSMPVEERYRHQLNDIVNDVVFGQLWSDETIPLADRSLITIGILSALGRESQLVAHVRGARGLGIPADKLRSVCLHVAAYAGVPAGYSALTVVDRVLSEMQDENAAQ